MTKGRAERMSDSATAMTPTGMSDISFPGDRIGVGDGEDSAMTDIIDFKELRKRRLEAATGCKGLNPDLSVNMNDPCNAPYLESIEDLARSMADAIYSAALDEIDGDLTTEQDDALYEQCLVDSRRMLLDPEYLALIEGMA